MANHQTVRPGKTSVQVREARVSAAASSLEGRDKAYVWHPFTQMLDWVQDEPTPPIVIERGEGCTLIDTQGRRYLDGISSLWVNVHGHRHPKLDQAVRDQLDKIAHSTMLGFSNVPAIQLAEQLVQLAPPGLTKVFYSDSGSTAVEIALKMAFQYWQQVEEGRYRKKTRFLTLRNAYHGDTLGSVSVGGIDLFHQMYRSLLMKTVQAPSPHCYRCELGKDPETCHQECIEAVEALLQTHHQELAALIIEPLVQAAAGILTMPKGYVERIRALCDRYQVLLIADEVAVGIGRTGSLFACEQVGVTPDLLTIAKGLTGGYLPLAATLATQEIYEAFQGEYKACKTFFHGHSYTGNPLACAAALANLQIFAEEETLTKLQPKIALLKEWLAPLSGRPYVGEVRQCGLMVGIELVKDRATKEPYPWEEKMGVRVCTEALKHGVLLRPLGNVIVLFPPLTMTEPDLRKIVDTVDTCIQSVCGT